MTRLGRRGIGCGVLLGFLSVQVTASAAQVAYDSAGGSAYNNGFTQGSSGGYGWGGGWSIPINTPGLALAGLGDSTTNNGLGIPLGIGDINSPQVAGGRAWALNGEDSASRPFAAPLGMGQTFSADFDNGLIGPDVPRDWMSVANGSDGMSFGIEDVEYVIRYPGSEIGTFVPISYDGIHVSFTREPGGYLVAITPYGPSNLPVPPYPPFPPGTTAYVTVPFDQPVDSVTFSIADRGANLTNDVDTLYFNNIQITPEPGGAALLAVAAWAMLRRRACSAA